MLLTASCCALDVCDEQLGGKDAVSSLRYAISESLRF
jgi:hypothetical protein